MQATRNRVACSLDRHGDGPADTGRSIEQESGHIDRYKQVIDFQQVLSFCI
jgi:hypothetical protein